jgi:hypothetical protein
MVRGPFHLTDEDILGFLDGEVSRRHEKHVHAHLNACWSCRSRAAELEATIEEFVALHRQTLNPRLPDVNGGRALLKARLAEAAAQPSSEPRPRFLDFLASQRAAAYVCLAVVVSLLAGTFFYQRFEANRPVAYTTAAVPDRNLTPGATRPISLGDVCSMPHEEVVSDVPDALREQVFKEYGIANARPQDYEIDYLIAPGLGGTEDIHNLWPEPLSDSAWNARVKDELEERLHQLVCNGTLDLNTAQQAIAKNWITAYKKYLGTERFVSQSRNDSFRHSGEVAERLVLSVLDPG